MALNDRVQDKENPGGNGRSRPPRSSHLKLRDPHHRSGARLSELEDIRAKIAIELKSQYLISYHATNSNEDTIKAPAHERRTA
jgi:hypothetical protein